MSAAAANGQHGTDLLRANVKGHAADIIAHGLGHRNMSNAEHHHAATTMTARSASELGATWCRRAARAVKQRLLDQQQLFREYQYIVALDDTIKHPQADALRTECAGRNRYANVLPYDYNRVILPNSSGCNYINASKVQLQPPHTGGPTSYIATQGPLPQTAEHFWRMVLESRTPAVVMLTNCIEKGTIKCAQYFPTARGEAAAFGALQLQVLLHERFSADCDRRTMRITDASTGSVLELQHFHYHTWPDHGVPEDSATLRRMCRELQRLRSGCGSGCASSGSSGADCGVGDRVSGTALAVMETGTPVLHCSAGIGRTGTFIAVDVILRRIDAWFRAGGPTKEEVEEALDMPRLVHSLRQQRFGMVQTLEQYCFVYKATLDELEERQQQHQGAVAAARAAAGGSGAQGRG